MSDKAAADAGDDKKTSVMEDPMAKKQMDDLFAVVQNNESSQASQKKWKERELPPSFFDASSNSGPGLNSPDKFSSDSKPRKPFPRLGPSINLGPPQMAHHHMRSTSMPATLDLLNAVPLPPGWEASKTPDGLTYYIE